MKKKRSTLHLFIMAAVSLVLMFISEYTPVKTKDDLYELKVSAALNMQESLAVIYNYRIENNIDYDELSDPNKTGVIGAEYSEITTTLGPLEVKRTTTNPDFAALMVQLFTDVGLGKGDLIAVGASGSFPALAIAVQAAANVMEMDVLSIISIGASTYGATDIDLTIADMERELLDAGYYKTKSIGASVGGEDDELINPMFPEASAIANNIIIRNNITTIDTDSFQNAVSQRCELYRNKAGARKISAFINIGGAEVNVGNGSAGYRMAAGHVKRMPELKSSVAGVIHYMFEDNIPVINLLNIKELCLKYDIPYDPIPLPIPGTSGIYYKSTPTAYYVIILIIYLGIMFGIIIRNRKKNYV